MLVEGSSILGRLVKHDEFSHLVLPLNFLSILMVRRRGSAVSNHAGPAVASRPFILRDAAFRGSSG
jgi:hypothetical protein